METAWITTKRREEMVGVKEESSQCELREEMVCVKKRLFRVLSV